MRILVVEDDKDVAGFVVRGLKEAGHNVEHADNGRDGLFLAATALRLMEKRKITSIVVVDAENRLEGVLHLHDLWTTQLF